MAVRQNQLDLKRAELQSISDKAQAEADAVKGITAAEQSKTLKVKEQEAEIAAAEKKAVLEQKNAEIEEQKLNATIRKKADADRYAAEQQADAQMYTTQKHADAELYLRQQEAQAIQSTADADAHATEVKGTLTLSDGSNLPFRLIGILHDDKADGSGRKAGLTFMAWNALPKAYAMNNSHTNNGGWRDSLLRNQMNNGEIWNQFPTDFQNNVTTVLKQTNNMAYGSTVGSSASATADKVWLVSYRELVPTLYDGWKTSGGFQALNQEGSQYEYFHGKVTNNWSGNSILSGIYKTVSGSAPLGAYYDRWWERSPDPGNYTFFLHVYSDGDPSYYLGADYRYSVVPAFSF